MCSSDFWFVCWSALSSLVFTLKCVFCNKFFVKLSGEHRRLIHLFDNGNSMKGKGHVDFPLYERGKLKQNQNQLFPLLIRIVTFVRLFKLWSSSLKQG